MRRFYLFIFLTGGAVFLDQLTKFYAQNFFQSGYEIVPNFIHLTLHYNDGIALSLPLKGELQIGVIIILLIFGVIYSYKQLNFKLWSHQLICAAILGGALGNLLDRLWYGSVIDFIAIWRFPIFNLADIFIFCGICGLIYLEMRKEH